MASLAKTHISITDDSAYTSGIDTLIPLYVFATEQDKVIDETTGEVALGTTKAFANQVSIVTSKKDVINQYGSPIFAESNGTILQGDETNEYGLFGLFDAMGSTSFAYALRADIDLKQLKAREEEPTSNVKNGTYWLDMNNTSLGLFKCTSVSSKPANDWVERLEVELYDHKPLENEGIQGDYAIFFTKGEQKIYEKLSSGWFEIGSAEWLAVYEGAKLYHQTSIKYPKEYTANSIWVKTSSVNNGANYVLKRYSASAKKWDEISVPMVASDDAATKLYADRLTDGVFVMIYDEEKANATLKVYSNKSWMVAVDVIASMFEPRAIAEEGTLWFNNDYKVDIMVNKNGEQWVGLNVAYPNAKLYVTSEEPTFAVAEESIWVNTYSENYPEIRRFIGGEWVLVNNADQTTPNGVVFADARYYIEEDAEPTYSVSNGVVESNLLTSSFVDADCINPEVYPTDILLFNTRFSTNNVKEYRKNPFVGLATSDGKYKVGAFEGQLTSKLGRWVSASGNAVDGSGLFGAKAQRAMVVKALASAIVSNEEIRSQDYDFFFATCPGYPEVDDELINLNIDKKEMFEIISDTPKSLRPNGVAIQEWGNNSNNASSHGSEGRVLRSEFMTRQYPPMGLTSNVDGSEIAVPSSVAKMKNLLVLPRGQIAAGTQNGLVTNLASVGYITKEGEYASVVVNDGLGEIITSQNINPIMPRRNTGLLFWGESTENSIESALSDEHAIITLLRLKRELEKACLPYFFRINTESLRNDFKKSLTDILNTFVGTNEIYDYAIEVESENTPDRINRKELWASIAIEIAKGIEQIYLPIRVVSTGALSK
jgi:hypothetical protein